jgi:hypothetical protein
MARAATKSSGVLTFINGSHFATGKSTRRVPIGETKFATRCLAGDEIKRRHDPLDHALARHLQQRLVAEGARVNDGLAIGRRWDRKPASIVFDTD